MSFDSESVSLTCYVRSFCLFMASKCSSVHVFSVPTRLLFYPHVESSFTILPSNLFVSRLGIHNYLRIGFYVSFMKEELVVK